jgi:hypothetical protein
MTGLAQNVFAAELPQQGWQGSQAFPTNLSHSISLPYGLAQMSIAGWQKQNDESLV